MFEFRVKNGRIGIIGVLDICENILTIYSAKLLVLQLFKFYKYERGRETEREEFVAEI
jgi:hypothetical protein